MEFRRSYAYGFMALTVLLLVAAAPESGCLSLSCNEQAGRRLGQYHSLVALADSFMSRGLTSEPRYDCTFQRGLKVFPSMAIVDRPTVRLDHETTHCGLCGETIATRNFFGFGRHLGSRIPFSAVGKDLVLRKSVFLS